ncbi:MAG: HAMP domain-containing protein [Bacteroidia bacterium]|nr:HAMP domain-containing protein [Bacteroidia bacterium]
MKIKNKLSLLFTLLTAAILLTFAALIYFSASQSRENEFYKSLKKEAITKANLFLNAKVDAQTLQTIYKNNREILNEVEVAIYDTTFNLLYHDAVDIDFVKENKAMIDEIQIKDRIEFYQKEWQVVGIEYKFENRNYIVIAAAYDQYGYRKIDSLGKTILIVFIISIAFIYLVGRFYSKRALDPIIEMNKKVKDISATNLHLRLDDKGKDELADLASVFNEMLEKLEQSFDSQKGFVSNISHELRTPLSTIITELQLSENKDRSIEEYKAVIQRTLNDAQKLAKLSGSLLDFAKASYDTSAITFKNTRLDELLLDAQLQLIKTDKSYNISLSYEGEIEEEIILNANEYLLKTAFLNLMENACKFSGDKHCSIEIDKREAHTKIRFIDKGVGISEQDMTSIFIPFYRGKNKAVAEGNGIGLTLTKRIIELHGGTIAVSSQLGAGTIFTVTLPNNKN